MFKVGDKVITYLDGAGYTTKEKARKIIAIDERGVWLDNGSGNDPSGPFDPETGDYENNAYVAGMRMYIK